MGLLRTKCSFGCNAPWQIMAVLGVRHADVLLAKGSLPGPDIQPTQETKTNLIDGRLPKCSSGTVLHPASVSMCLMQRARLLQYLDMQRAELPPLLFNATDMVGGCLDNMEESIRVNRITLGCFLKRVIGTWPPLATARYHLYILPRMVIAREYPTCWPMQGKCAILWEIMRVTLLSQGCESLPMKMNPLPKWFKCQSYNGSLVNQLGIIHILSIFICINIPCKTDGSICCYLLNQNNWSEIILE